MTLFATAVAVSLALQALEPSTAAPDDAKATLALKPCVSFDGPILTHVDGASLPLPGVPAEVEIGQSMVSKIKLTVRQEGILLTKPFTLTGKYMWQSYEVTVPSGEMRKTSVYEVYKPDDFTFQYANESHPRAGFAKPYLAFNFKAPSELNGVVIVGFAKQVIPVPPENFEVEKCIANDNGFRRELVYSGVSQGTITLLYREYVNDLARPAFTQELHYDLKDGDENGYKGARFKVLKATNTSISYMVIRPID